MKKGDILWRLSLERDFYSRKDKITIRKIMITVSKNTEIRYRFLGYSTKRLLPKYTDKYFLYLNGRKRKDCFSYFIYISKSRAKCIKRFPKMYRNLKLSKHNCKLKSL